jgi:hypothetical protein
MSEICCKKMSEPSRKWDEILYETIIGKESPKTRRIDMY